MNDRPSTNNVKNTMEDLRNHLFATIEALQDPEKPMDVERARAINQTAQTLINSAKVEVDYIEVTGHQGNGKFFRRITDGGTVDMHGSELRGKTLKGGLR